MLYTELTEESSGDNQEINNWGGRKDGQKYKQNRYLYPIKRRKNLGVLSSNSVESKNPSRKILNHALPLTG